MNTLLRDVTDAAKLISLPGVYLRLKSILDSPDFAMAEVAAVISQDPSITIRLLHLVNSSLYGFSKKIETVSHAITLLGTQQIHDIVLTTSIAQSFQGMSTKIMDMRKFWHQSVYSAVTSRLLATQCNGCDREPLFVAGLLHDIGHLIMYQAIPDLCQEAIAMRREGHQPLHLIEQDLFGFNAALIGAELIQQWELSERLRETTMLHIAPDKAKKYFLETAIVHLASLITQAQDGVAIFNQGPLTVHPSAWQISGLTPEDCFSLQGQIDEETEEIVGLIFSP